MEFRKTLIWSLINGESHPELTEKERSIEGAMPVIDSLFPGINYYSVTGFGQVYRDYTQPVLTKLFPNLNGLEISQVNGNESVEIKPFLPSQGYEHLDNPEWKTKLEELLLA